MLDQAMLIINVIIVLGAVVYCAAYWFFREKNTDQQSSAGGLNFSEITILFQTLRSLIHEQKLLAQEFNKSVDKKVAAIREVTKAFADERERLATAQKELRNVIEGSGATAQLEILPEVKVTAPTTSEPQTDSEDLVDNWVGLDFLGDDEKLEEPVAAEPEESLEVREQTRDAVNALLGMGEPPKPAGTIHPFPDIADEEEIRGRGDNLSAVRMRAYKYHDAGMTVTQIAKELGIGRGEVRLMLNLREKAE